MARFFNISQNTKRDYNERRDILRYTSEINKLSNNDKLLSKEEERKLFEAYRLNNDLGAREKLITLHLKTALFVANKFSSTFLKLSDMVSEGNIALVKAVDNFDYLKSSARFYNYAIISINFSLMRALKEQNLVIKTGSDRIYSYNLIANVSNKLEQILEREPSNIELYDYIVLNNIYITKTKLTYDVFLDILFCKKDVSSFDGLKSENDSEFSLLDVLINSDSDEADSSLIDELESNVFNSLVDDVFKSTLSEEESSVLKLYFGFYKEIGEDLSTLDITKIMGFNNPATTLNRMNSGLRKLRNNPEIFTLYQELKSRLVT